MSSSEVSHVSYLSMDQLVNLADKGLENYWFQSIDRDLIAHRSSYRPWAFAHGLCFFKSRVYCTHICQGVHIRPYLNQNSTNFRVPVLSRGMQCRVSSLDQTVWFKTCMIRMMAVRGVGGWRRLRLAGPSPRLLHSMLSFQRSDLFQCITLTLSRGETSAPRDVKTRHTSECPYIDPACRAVHPF
jgi:hypothetical protein